MWEAYERLEAGKVKKAGTRRLLTDLVSLVRFATRQAEELEPFGLTVQQRFERWIGQQEASGRSFTPDQRRWLEMIRDHISTSLTVEPRDFNNIPFNEYGGLHKARELFGEDFTVILRELNEELAA